MLTQAGADAIYGGTISYDPQSDTFTGDMAVSSDTISALQAAAPTDTTEHTASYWGQVVEYIALTKGLAANLTGDEITLLDYAITATDGTLSFDYIENPLRSKLGRCGGKRRGRRRYNLRHVGE